MEAELSDVEESQLVALREVDCEQLREAVLGHSQRFLHSMTSTASLRLLSKLHVHFLDAVLEKCRIILVSCADHLLQSGANEDLTGWVDFAVKHDDLGKVVDELPGINFER